jgi:TonB family protein
MSQRILASMAVGAALVIGCAAPVAAQQAPVRVGGDIKEPRRITDVKPVYPQIAQQAGIQGIVIIEAIIGVDGAVEQARVLRPVPLLDQAALDAVHQWRYVPTELNGQPVPVVMTVTVSFTLDQAGAPKQELPVVSVAEMLDNAKALHQRGLYDETERVLQRALAALQAERIRNTRAITGAGVPAPGATPVRVGGDIREPTLLTRVEPVYGAGAPAGVTVAEITIDGSGRVTDARIMRSQGAEVDAAVVAALRQWVFRPTLLNGVPVAMIMTVTIK